MCEVCGCWFGMTPTRKAGASEGPQKRSPSQTRESPVRPHQASARTAREHAVERTDAEPADVGT